MSIPAYEVYAIRYAKRSGRRPEHFVGGDPHDASISMDYSVRLFHVPCSVARLRGRVWGRQRCASMPSPPISPPQHIAAACQDKLTSEGNSCDRL